MELSTKQFYEIMEYIERDKTYKDAKEWELLMLSNSIEHLKEEVSDLKYRLNQIEA